MAPRILAPQPGPQTQFLACGADVVLYGGAAYGGKSFGLLLDALRYCKTPGWNGLIIRKKRQDLIGSGSIFEKARKVYEGTGAKFRGGGEYIDVRWPSGAMLAFRHLEKGNVKDYQGLEFAWIGIDEATHLELDWITYLITRRRTDCGTKAVVRMTCNPERDHALREWVSPYLLPNGTADREQSGRVRYFQVGEESGKIAWGDTREEAARVCGRPPEEIMSFAFIPSWLSDNPIGLRDNPNYVASLAIAGPVEEAKLRHGNWNVREDTGGMLARARWGGILTAPLSPIVRRYRGWDTGATRPLPGTDPDFTVGVRVDFDLHGRFYISGLAACRLDTPDRDAYMRTIAELDVIAGGSITHTIPFDPGAGGKDAVYHHRRNLSSVQGVGPIVDRRQHGNKVVRATPLARALEVGLDGERHVNDLTVAADRNEDRGRALDAAELRRRLAAARIPAGYILDADGWMEQPYRDGGNAPTTLGALLWSMLDPFPFGTHDDVVDGLSDAYNEGAAPPARRLDPRERARLSVRR